MPTRKRRIANDIQSNEIAVSPVVSEHAADDAADAPTQQRDGDDRADIGGNLRILRRVEQGAHGRTDRQDQGIEFEPVEQPAEIGGEQDVPLVTVEAAIPRLPQGDGVGHGHPLWLADPPTRVACNRGAPQPRGFMFSRYWRCRRARGRPNRRAL